MVLIELTPNPKKPNCCHPYNGDRKTNFHSLRFWVAWREKQYAFIKIFDRLDYILTSQSHVVFYFIFGGTTSVEVSSAFSKFSLSISLLCPFLSPDFPAFIFFPFSSSCGGGGGGGRE